MIEKINQLEDRYHALLKHNKMLGLKEQQATALAMELNNNDKMQHWRIVDLERKLRDMPKLISAYNKGKQDREKLKEALAYERNRPLKPGTEDITFTGEIDG